MLLDFLLLAVGLVMLYYGGDLLVTGSIRVSHCLKISPFIIGAIVVGFGTSSPELAVSVYASLKGAPELAMGNVIGSNIANVGLVLGLTAFLIPLSIGAARLKSETPALLIATFLILALVWDNSLSRMEGGILVILLFVYILISLRKRDAAAEETEDTEEGLFAGRGLFFQFALIAGGLVMLVVGADFLVDGAVGIAQALGVSEWFIGVSIVAVGTSLPEIVSSILAAKRGHGEMSIGNVFGSNIFNILMVLGVTAVIHPLHIHEPIHPDLIFTTGLTCLLLILIRIEHVLSSRDGFILLVCYCGYIGGKGAGWL